MGHDAMVAGGVRAAGRGFHRAGGGVAAVVVTGHDLVQNRFVSQAGGVGVVVDHVEAHLDAGAMQRLHPRLEPVALLPALSSPTD